MFTKTGSAHEGYGSKVYVLGASSLEKAVKSLQYKERRAYNFCVTAIPGLSLNPLTCNPLKNLGNILEKGYLAKQRNLVLWHDLINNSVSEHWKHRTPALPVEELVTILKRYQDRVKAIVYCRRFGTPDIYKQLKTSGIPVISVRRNLVSKRKQRNHELQKSYSALHQQRHLELKSLDIVLRNADNISFLTKNTRTIKNRLSQKKRRSKQNSK